MNLFRRDEFRVTLRALPSREVKKAFVYMGLVLTEEKSALKRKVRSISVLGTEKPSPGRGV